MKRIKDNFTNSTAAPANVASELYEKWLMPRVNRQPFASSEWLLTSDRATSNDDAVTKGFNSIASSDSSLWLMDSSSDDMMLSEQPSHFDVSPWLLQSSSTDKEKTVPLGQDYGKWLFTGNAVKKEDNYQAWLTAASQPATTWLHQGYNSDSNEQWLLPRG